MREPNPQKREQGPALVYRFPVGSYRAISGTLELHGARRVHAPTTGSMFWGRGVQETLAGVGYS